MYRDGKFYIKLAIPDGITFPTHTSIETGSLFYREDQGITYIYSGGWLPIANYLSGDITISGATVTVIALQGLPISSESPASGEALRWDGTQWVPSGVGTSQVGSFLDLDDTPTDYASFAGYSVVVNDLETGLEFEEITVSGEAYQINRYSAGVLTQYDPDDAGLASAIAATSAGDTIWIPPVTFSNNYTVPSGVTMAGTSITDVVFNGAIALENGAVIEHLTVDRNKNDASDYYGVLGPNTGIAYIKHCWISVSQLGAGDGYGIQVYDRDGDIHVYGGRVYGSTSDVLTN